jgi:hypothetical protein
MLAALLESGTAEWLSILVFIFGGCCSNVWALEAVLKQHPSSGTFLTFAQIVYVALQNVSSHVYRPPGAWIPRVRARAVPLWKWGVQVVLFLGVSLCEWVQEAGADQSEQLRVRVQDSPDAAHHLSLGRVVRVDADGMAGGWEEVLYGSDGTYGDEQ